jgi:hypothetical protein
MSGGSMNYAYVHVENAIGDFKGDTPYRRAFKVHLEKVAKAMKDIEWVDSCDCAEGTENAAIMECIDSSDILKTEISRAESVLSDLKAAIEKARFAP